MAYANNDAYGQTEQGYGGYDGYGQSHEMQQYPQQGSGALSTNDFLNQVTGIRGLVTDLTKDIKELGRFRSAALNDADGAAQQLEARDADIRAQRQRIFGELQALTDDVSKTTDGSKGVKEQHLNTLKNTFKESLRTYAEDEARYRQAVQAQFERQYRIVNPDATEQEVQQAAATGGNEAVFQQALMSNRTNQATSVLGNVRARHHELQNIEKSLIELSTMIQDLDQLVVQQEVAVQAAEQNAENTTKWTAEGNDHVGKGIKSARNRRKLKWWCLLICILIIIIAVGVGAGVACSNGLCGSKKSSN